MLNTKIREHKALNGQYRIIFLHNILKGSKSRLIISPIEVH
jgi:hypothetical protein